MNNYSKYDNIIMSLYEQGVTLGELIVWNEMSYQLDNIDDYNIADDEKENMKKYIFEESLDMYYDTNDISLSDIVSSVIYKYLDNEEESE
jgi:hypothetical protein